MCVAGDERRRGHFSLVHQGVQAWKVGRHCMEWLAGRNSERAGEARADKVEGIWASFQRLDESDTVAPSVLAPAVIAEVVF